MENHNYHMDRRTRAAYEGSLFLEVDERRMIGTVVLDGQKYQIGIRFEVCDVCDGKGSHVNPSIDAGGISAERFHEDPEFAQQYFGGTYDQVCNGCGGRRVVPVPDPRTDEQRNLMEHLKAEWAEKAAYQRQCARERAMGC